MTVRITPNPVRQADDEFVGLPLHIPWVLLCTHGERWCGWHRIANSPEKFVLYAADRRVHESSCRGGIVPVTRMPS
jgi:hypothetical protein